VRVDFEMDAAGIRRIAVGPALRKACLEAVGIAAAYAVSISPRSNRTDNDDDHPHYQDSFRVRTVHTGLAPESIGHPPMRRIGARLVNVARHAAVVEFGRRGRRGHHILRKTLEHIDSGGRRRG
jgi:hypothetical protein